MTVVLVAHASKHGSTAEIAAAIAARLRERGIDGVQEHAVSDVTDVAGYDAMVLGSAVYMGSWMKEASGFVRDHADALAKLPVWLFCSGPIIGADRDALSRKQREALDEITPRGLRIFGGVVDPSRLGFMEKRVVKMVHASEGDHRDWDEVRAFADEIADALEVARV